MTGNLRRSQERVELNCPVLNMLSLPPFGSSFQQMLR